MGAFDLEQRTIRHSSWVKGEEVVIREMTFAESARLTSIAMADVSMGDVDDKEKIAAMKMGELDMGRPQIETLQMCIVSWTFKQSGKVMSVTLPNIKKMKGTYGDFIYEEIDKFNPEPDADFPEASGVGGEGNRNVSGGDDSGDNPGRNGDVSN